MCFGIGADRADLDELRDVRQPRLLHELDAHDRVLVEEAAGVLAVRADAADDRGEVDDRCRAVRRRARRSIPSLVRRSYERCAGRRRRSRPPPEGVSTTARPRKPAPPVTRPATPRPLAHRDGSPSQPDARSAKPGLRQVGLDHQSSRAPRTASVVPSRARAPPSTDHRSSSSTSVGRKYRPSTRTCVLPVQADEPERHLAELADRVHLAGGDHVVVRGVAAGASATSPRRTRGRSPSRGARPGCRGRAVRPAAEDRPRLPA